MPDPTTSTTLVGQAATSGAMSFTRIYNNHGVSMETLLIAAVITFVVGFLLCYAISRPGAHPSLR